MIQQVRQLRTTEGARALALALIAASLVALAGVGGYEVGTLAGQPHAAAAQSGGPSHEAPPITGLQP